MSNSEHSFVSYSESETLGGYMPANGSYRVRYQPRADWDFNCDVLKPDQSINLSLLLPHYRALGQPSHHRMNMFIGNMNAPIKAKVVRNSRTRFYLEVQAMDSDVVVYLPSDFSGTIYHKGKASYSPGFTNRIAHNVYINEESLPNGLPHEDSVVVYTKGRVTFRMWDIHTGHQENVQMETLKRLFGGGRRVAKCNSDWDFLLEG